MARRGSVKLRRMRAAIAWIATAGVITLAGAPQVDVTRIGRQVGQELPAFTVTDQRGTPTTLPSVMGPGRVLPLRRLVTLLQDAARAAATFPGLPESARPVALHRHRAETPHARLRP